MLLSICGEFTTEMGKYIYGDAGYASFFQDIHAEFRKLTEEIRCTKPRFDIPKSAERTNTIVESKPSLPAFTFRAPSAVAGCSDPESTDGGKRAHTILLINSNLAHLCARNHSSEVGSGAP